MRRIRIISAIIIAVMALTSFPASAAQTSSSEAPIPAAKKPTKADKMSIDFSKIRGFNYTPAGVAQPRHHTDAWVLYNEETACFDMDLAQKLNLNQARVFVNYQVYQEIGTDLAPILRHYFRECAKRGISVMPVVGNGEWVRDPSKQDLAEEWAKFLVNTLKNEPNLSMWDISNEPDYTFSDERKAMNYKNCEFMSKLFHELDPNTPVTIGCATVKGMKDLSEYVDILQFHDYSDTREGIRNTIKEAREFSEQTGKPVFNGEMGCIARANPYDVTLQEHQEAGMGWYIWELMIVRKGWGNVHGVFYEDGTVRDPSIAAAILGFFRNRDNIRLEEPDAENKITKALQQIYAWKADGSMDFDKGIYAAEVAANLLEAGQLAPMHIAPLYEVNEVRASKDISKLDALVTKFASMLEPYKKEIVVRK